jgi:hypothetical protein
MQCDGGTMFSPEFVPDYATTEAEMRALLLMDMPEPAARDVLVMPYEDLFY